MLSQLACLGRHTITGVICTAGSQYRDWSAEYRLYSKDRFCEQALFNQVRLEVEGYLKADEPLTVAMDDSLFRKTGQRIHGVQYRRDPLGPKFQVSFVRAQRILQISAALPSSDGAARMVPIDFLHAPMPKKPRKTDSQKKWELYKQQRKLANISKHGIERICALRQRMDESSDNKRKLQVVVDGGYTNRNVLRNLPRNTTLIGRIREDAKLYYLPEFSKSTGRKRVYGQQAPTPKQLRQDESIAWRRISAVACGKQHNFKVKTLTPVRWRASGKVHDLRLVVIAPLGYRLKKGGRMLYRKPAYLICTDPNLSIQKILQAYIYRWDIEVNFRDEKTLLGVGQAQVRTKKACQKVPALAIAAYSMLLTAAAKAFGTTGIPQNIPAPKWRNDKKQRRASTQALINQLRFELWSTALTKKRFPHFANKNKTYTKSDKLKNSLDSALFSVAN